MRKTLNINKHSICLIQLKIKLAANYLLEFIQRFIDIYQVILILWME